MEQQTAEWHEYRRNGLGSSDAPVVMGVSPYMSRRELWLEKRGLFEPKRSEFVMRLGQEFEPKARARFELDTALEVEPEVVEHESENWLRASLDACSFKDKIFAEIKYMGRKNFDLVRSGQILPYHFPQLQHQFLVTGFEIGYYVVYTLSNDKKDIEDYFSLKIFPDNEYINSQLVPNLRKFWHCVKNDIDPDNIFK